jgi:hypothetical protein
MLAWLFLIVVLAVVGKLVYDIQSKKKQTPTQLNDEFANKEAFQKLAGIGVPKPDKNTEVINGYKELAEKWAKAGFPEPDASIPVTTTKITTIDTNFGSDNDPLVSVPMSRVSNEAKQKMAEIAREDINKQLEKNVEKFASIFPDEVEYTDEYYKKVPVASNPLVNAMINAVENDQRLGMEFVKPKRKYTKKSKK